MIEFAFIARVANDIGKALKKYSPEILTGVGITGMMVTTITAVAATPKALKLMDRKKVELNTDKLTATETIKTVWQCYVPPAVIGLASTACLIGASATNANRNAALAAAYTFTESAMQEYKSKVIDTIGKRKERAIREDISKDRIANNPVREVILTERGGNTICYDPISGRYFKSDKDTISRIVNDLNRRMRDEMYISLNEFYYAIGLDSISIGNDIGWGIDKGYIDITFSSHLDANGTPCLVMDYCVAPTYDYQ